MRKLHLTILLAIAGLFSLLAMPGVTHAQRGENLEERLERVYERLVFASDGLQFRLGQTADIVSATEAYISTLNEQGIDTSPLSAALVDFQAGVATAQGYADGGAAVLATHAGFDDSGGVTDAEVAVETLREAGRQLRDGHDTLRDATIEFRRVVTDFNRALREER